ncbi:hypothetical protein CDAR_603281 [Caerostris darwini]|uniref:Secreted protein n=1 Tax=Caerostris darwini TaxID=1538125 RepID=A0AAV4SV55_9ARAC|nr:hypothetical protein CDAR_603281 [Caerostris darwini]
MVAVVSVLTQSSRTCMVITCNSFAFALLMRNPQTHFCLLAVANSKNNAVVEEEMVTKTTVCRYRSGRGEILLRLKAASEVLF